MKGLALTASVASQLVVAKKKTAERSAPSGNSAQTSVDHAAMASSVRMPAEATCSRCRRLVRRQASLVSVYAIGHITTKATPMVGTRQPRRLAVKAWPSSCSSFTTISALP